MSSVAYALAPYSKELAAVFLSIFGALFARAIQPKAKLIHSIRHGFMYIVPEPLRDAQGNVVQQTQTVNVQSFSVANVGKSTATRVEIVFNWRPEYFNVWPLRHYEVLGHPDNRFSVVLDSLAPKEAFGMELLAVNRELPAICNVRSEQVGSVKRMMMPQIVFIQLGREQSWDG